MSSTPPNHVLFNVDDDVGRAFYWLSTGLAVLTALLQGLVTAIALMTESSNQWTFRFRLARVEHYWWTAVSVALLASLVMVALSFVSGNGGDPVSVLALSSATFLATIRYTLPAWQHRHYIETRWLAWTGASRTAISKSKQGLCGDNRAWMALVNAHKNDLARLQPTPSDYYGWRLWRAPGIPYDPTNILNVVRANTLGASDPEKQQRPVGIYENANVDTANVSLLWGPLQGFRRVASRAVSSMPLNLLRSNPTTTDGYDGKGLTTAMGILGRNKGLQPWKLVFNTDSGVTSLLESTSTWTPRPTKVLRSFYKNALTAQYGGLGDSYVNAAVELALLVADIPHWAINEWLKNSLEHQSLNVNNLLADEILAGVDATERTAGLTAHYESSYVSMILSLNYMDGAMKNKRESRNATLCRPDVLCTGLLLKARGHRQPSWWNDSRACGLRQREIAHLPADSNWKPAVVKLLGLTEWPNGFDDNPSRWEEGDRSGFDTALPYSSKTE